MRLEFHGVRGGLPTPGGDTTKFGGNTTCFAIRTRSNDLLVFDAGTGIRRLGMDIMQAETRNALALEAFVEFNVCGLLDLAKEHLDTLKSQESVKPYKPEIHLFFTHYHWDHIHGFPFFVPAYIADRALHIYGPLKADHRLVDVLSGQMSGTYFPITLEQMQAKRHYREILDDTMRINDTLVVSRPLNHPQGSLGYRVTSGECNIVIATDTEHPEHGMDENLLALAEGADALIYDSQYTPEEYEMKRGWGHSTWQEGIRIARAAGVKQLYLCHHDPAHNDAFLEGIETQAREQFPNTSAIAEGAVLQLRPEAPTPLGEETDAEADAAQKMPAFEVLADAASVRCTTTFRGFSLPDFQRRLHEVVGYGARTVRFLCPDVAHYSGDGLVALADTIRYLKDNNVAARLEQVPDTVRQRLLAARFDTVADIKEE